MITARRSTESSTYEPAKGGVDLLERPRNYEESSIAPAVQADFSEEKVKRHDNLEKLLNYDRYAEQTMQATEVESDVDVCVETASLAEEDIRPTSTTMQFGEDIDQIRKEMNLSRSKEEETYHLNKRGKLVVTLYALAVTVILALIVLNTNVLAGLNKTAQAKAVQLDATVAQYNAIQSELDAMSSSDYIINVAENQYGMVRK